MTTMAIINGNLKMTNVILLVIGLFMLDPFAIIFGSLSAT
jgi:hypothetical protein